MLAESPCQDGRGGDGGDDDDSVGTVRQGLLMQFAQQVGPAENSDIGTCQNRDKVDPDTHSEQIADHAADDWAGHPERQPDKGKQADDAVLTHLVFVPLGSFVGAVGESFEPSSDKQLLPDEDKQRIKYQHQNGFKQHTDQDNADVANLHGITNTHADDAAEDDLGGGHAEQGVEVVRVCEQFKREPQNIQQRHGDSEDQDMAFGAAHH